MAPTVRVRSSDSNNDVRSIEVEHAMRPNHVPSWVHRGGIVGYIKSNLVRLARRYVEQGSRVGLYVVFFHQLKGRWWQWKDVQRVLIRAYVPSNLKETRLHCTFAACSCLGAGPPTFVQKGKKARSAH